MTMSHDELARAAADHLWLHFSRLADEGTPPLTVIERGQGAYVWDDQGNRYLDGLAGLFVVQAGHGRVEIAEAASRQAAQLGYFPLWSYAHPAAIELAARLADLAPGDCNGDEHANAGGGAGLGVVEGSDDVHGGSLCGFLLIQAKRATNDNAPRDESGAGLERPRISE
jgi:4-aminobutyrate aminotransferase-like enzyme